MFMCDFILGELKQQNIVCARSSTFQNVLWLVNVKWDHQEENVKKGGQIEAAIHIIDEPYN